MTDPVSLSATAIATLAFTKAFEKTVENITQATWSKIDQLRQKIWLKLRSHFNQVEPVLNGAAQGSETDLEKVAEYLNVVMNEDSEFAAEVQMLARQINATKVQDNSSMNINNYENARAWQTKADEGVVNNIDKVEHLEQHYS
ncbi:MAG: hypothetical protein F6K31_27725 [Symploca sp. SIO2G7]|nr:hypothetical protein [Symploca sp. SIO2G7]